MAKVHPYLNFAGNTEEAFNFYKSVFGGEFTYLQRFSDYPDAAPVAPEEANKLMHVSLPIGDNIILMGTDALESMGQKLHFGDNVSLYISPDSREDADRLFSALSEGGKVDMPMEDMFWGDYFGAVVDKFGVQWMIGYNKDFQ